MSLPDLSGLRLDGPRRLDEPEQTGVHGAIRKAGAAIRRKLARSGVASTGYAALKDSIRANIRKAAETNHDCGCHLADSTVNRARQRWGEVNAERTAEYYNNMKMLNAERSERIRLVREALTKLADAPFIVQETTGVPAKHLGHKLDASIAAGLASEYFESKKLYIDAVKAGESYITAQGKAANRVVAKTDELIANAVRSAFQFFPDDGTVQRLDIKLRLMHLDSKNYVPGINERLHMDDAVGSVGSTYGLTAEDREPYFLITSFCADEGANVSPRECGTRLLEGVPIIHPGSIRAAAVALHQNALFETLCTERELFATLSRVCQEATEAALQQFTEERMQSMGIRFRSSPMLDWTYLNTLTFHRSPKMSEVLQTARTRHGVRGFVALFKEPPLSSSSRNQLEERPNTRVVETRTPRGDPLTVTIEVNVNEEGDWAMGEDMM
jgi:hypothetical protein